MAPKKNQKMSLGTFLQDENFGSWADEMEDMPLPEPQSRTSYGTDRRAFSTNTGMGGASFERRDNYAQREQLPLPTSPPYTAHLANLSFDATDLDVKEFFRDCQVTNVRIVEDKLDRKPKGFGYVEFGSLDGLKTALALTGGTLAGRQVRVSVADPPKDRQESRDFSDWSRKGPLPDLPGQQRRVSDRPGFNRSFDNMSDAGSERGGGGGGARRNFGGEGDGKVRDFSSWERKGPLSPGAATGGLSLREGGRQGSKDGSFRRNSPSWGDARSGEGSRPRREFADRPIPERQPTAADMDTQWRARMRPDAPAVPAATPSPDASIPSSPQPAAATAAAPTSRPRLNLQKRTVSEADPTAAASASGDSKASPFGAARPVDTAAKEREVEEKRQLAIRQKREAEEKARAEKAEEKKTAKDRGELERKESSSKITKETDEPQEEEEEEREEEEEEEKEIAQTTPRFDILRRASSNANDVTVDEEIDEETEGQAEDKAVKPKEIVRDAPGKANGAWRKGSEAATETTGEGLEDDGWSTVPKSGKQRNNRRNNNNAAARAIAS